MFLWGWGKRVRSEGIRVWFSADGVMGRVIGMKGTDTQCGSFWDREIWMKGNSKGSGSSPDGVKGCGL